MTTKVALFTLLAAVSYGQTQETATFSYNGLPLPIFGNQQDTISVATISVPRPLSIGNITVKVQIDYPNSGDLQVYLFSPTGIRVKLLENNCTVNGIDTVFDDAATSQWSQFCPTELGRAPFRGNEPLANVKSDPTAFGNWRLAVENTKTDNRTGFITGFALTITGTRQLTPTYVSGSIVNAGSRAGTSVAPGELLSIYGFSLGPTEPVTAPTGALPTTLGGVSVTFDGTAVPIAYASAYRVDVQAPFALQPGGQTTIRVTGSSGTGSNVQMPISPSAPGLFTTQADGSGLVKAINQDGSVNAITRGAAKGSIVSVFASGLGAVAPSVTAGAVPPNSPLSTTVSSVAASIGGLPARVVYAGLAPGIPGSYQINIEVPATAPSGLQALVISTNNIGSQSGTIQIN